MGPHSVRWFVPGITRALLSMRQLVPLGHDRHFLQGGESLFRKEYREVSPVRSNHLFLEEFLPQPLVRSGSACLLYPFVEQRPHPRVILVMGLGRLLLGVAKHFPICLRGQLIVYHQRCFQNIAVVDLSCRPEVH